MTDVVAILVGLLAVGQFCALSDSHVVVASIDKLWYLAGALKKYP